MIGMEVDGELKLRKKRLRSDDNVFKFNSMEARLKQSGLLLNNKLRKKKPRSSPFCHVKLLDGRILRIEVESDERNPLIGDKVQVKLVFNELEEQLGIPSSELKLLYNKAILKDDDDDGIVIPQGNTCLTEHDSLMYNTRLNATHFTTIRMWIRRQSCVLQPKIDNLLTLIICDLLPQR